MKTYCKKTDLTYKSFVRPMVEKYLRGGSKRPAKWKRNDFQRMIANLTCLDFEFVKTKVKEKDEIYLKYFIDSVTNEVVRQFSLDEYELQPIHYFERYDGVACKLRTISHESPLQQTIDYVIVYALMPMLSAKVLPDQYASIKGRGQVKGKEKIEKWIRRNKKCKYWVKIDVVKAFPSIKIKLVEKLLKRDIGKNKRLIDLVVRLLKTYIRKDKHGVLHDGLVIGTFLSQWICNYVMSYIYRFAMGISYVRRNVRYKVFTKILFYMDDMSFFGNNLSQIKVAIKKIARHLKEKFDLSIHDVWKVYESKKNPIDIMGYVIGYHYTTIRPKVFIRARRSYIRALREIKSGSLTLHKARSVTAYFGFFKHSNSRKIMKKLNIIFVTDKAKATQSRYSRKELIYAS